MKTSELIQLVAVGAVAYLAYQKFAVAKGPPAPQGPGATRPVTSPPAASPWAPDFGVDPSGGWNDTMSVSALTDLVGSWL